MYHPITGKVENIDSLLGGPDALNWYKSLTNEWGCWTQGVKNSSTISEHISGKHTMFLILSHQVPSGRKQGHLCNFCMHHGCALAKLNHGKSA
jgi:hypothetical protein